MNYNLKLNMTHLENEKGYNLFTAILPLFNLEAK